jgi:transcriptional regulator with XRE-family HTH domain
MISYQDKRKQFSPEAQARIDERANEIRSELRLLRTLREMLGISQEELAKRLEVDQSYISRLERRDNITLSSLANTIRALGGTVELTITIPEYEPLHVSGLESLYSSETLLPG